MAMTLNVLMLSTLFPDITRPNFGVFVERQARELADRKGVNVTVIAPVGMPPWPLSSVKPYGERRHIPREEHWRKLTVYRPRFLILPKLSGRFNVTAMTRAILPLVHRLHAQQPFDVIDASFFYPDGPVAARLARKLNIPFSIKARGADIHFWGRNPATQKLVMDAADRANGLLAVSEAMKRSMVGMGMDADKIRVHYTGVDLDRFQVGDSTEAKRAFGLSGPVVASIGALIERKGQPLLIQALRDLPDVTLVLVGQGPRRQAYERFAEAQGVADRVGFLGTIAHEGLPRLLAAADVMALPSSSEGLANAWVEALACGRPIVISDVGGARELMDRPVAGHIVERDPKAIATAIRDLLNNPPDPVDVRETALRFTWKANGDTLLAHLKALAEKS